MTMAMTMLKAGRGLGREDDVVNADTDADSDVDADGNTIVNSAVDKWTRDKSVVLSLSSI